MCFILMRDAYSHHIDEGRVLTSAGSAAGIDLCLHVIRSDFGAEIANHVAKRLVVPPHRDGDQSQYTTATVRVQGSHNLARVIEWVPGNLHRNLTVELLSAQARMSKRSFARRFRAEFGTTPLHWVTSQRMMAAQRWLETTDASVDRIAEAVGMTTAATLRHHFRRVFRTSPTAYRKHFTTLLR